MRIRNFFSTFRGSTVVLASYILSGLAAHIVYPKSDDLMLVLFRGVWLLTMFLTVYVFKIRTLHEIGFNRISKRHVFMAFIFLAVYIPLDYMIVMSFCNELACGRNPQDASEVALNVLLVTGFSMAILSPLTEEIAFRGIVQNELDSVVNRYASVIIVSVLWSLGHMHVYSINHIFWLFLFGAALGVLRLKSGSIIACIAIHSLINIFWILVWL